MELALDANGALNVDSFYKPLEKQQLLHVNPAKNLLGIGGNYSGKSLFLIGEAMYNVLEYPGANVLLLRKDFPQLEKGLILDFKNTVPKELFRYNDQKHIATFHNDSKIFFGHLKNGSEKDLAQYLSAAFVFIGVDELGQFSYAAYDFLGSRNRVNKGCQPNEQGLMPYCRMGGATNPMGPGYGWIKKLWIEKKPVSQLGDTKKIDGKFFSIVTDRGMLQQPEFLKLVRWIGDEPWICVYDPNDFFYVHSTILDNPFAAQRDPKAIDRLMKLAPALRQKALYGDLESVAGEYFSTFSYERNVLSLPRDADKIKFEPWQPVWIGFDWGLAHCSAIYWFTRAQVKGIDDKWRNCVVTLREMVVNEDAYKADRISRSRAEDWDYKQYLCSEIFERTPGPETGQKYEDSERGRLKFIFFSPERFSHTEDVAHTVAGDMSRILRGLGLPMCSEATDARVDGAQLMHDLLDSGEWVILDTCEILISAIETRVHNPDKLEDVLKTADDLDDAYDGARYGLTSMLREKGKPASVKLAEKLATIPDYTSRMVYAFVQKNKAEERKKPIKTRIVPAWRKGK